MANTVTITLQEPLVGHGEPVCEVVLRPPNLLEYARIGEPWSLVPGADGVSGYVENDQAISGYLECCVTEPRNKLLLAQVQLADAMRIKDAVLDFFGKARQASQSQTSPTSSPSTSD